LGRFLIILERVYKAVGADFRRLEPTATPPEGRFPTVRQSIFWDLLPSRLGPDADGLLAPKPPNTDWIRELESDDLELMYSVAQAARSARQDSIARAEGRASRLLTPTVTLLAACAALSAYQLNRSAQLAQPTFAVTAVPAVLGIAFFMISALRSLDADVRVGFHKNAELKESDGKLTRHEFLRECIRYEVVGEYWTRWTYGHKATSLMQARAWFSRGVLTLVLALIAAAITQLFPVNQKPPTPPTIQIIYPSPYPSTSSFSVPPTTATTTTSSSIRR
jgi:hypothetical protein